MAEGLSPIRTTPNREPESDRIRRVLGEYPEQIQDAARALAEKVPAIKQIALGNPHEVVREVVGRVRDAIHPPQS